LRWINELAISGVAFALAEGRRPVSCGVEVADTWRKKSAGWRWAAVRCCGENRENGGQHDQ